MDVLFSSAPCRQEVGVKRHVAAADDELAAAEAALDFGRVVEGEEYRVVHPEMTLGSNPTADATCETPNMVYMVSSPTSFANNQHFRFVP